MLALLLPLETLARATSAVTLVTFALANLALLRLKARDPVPPPGVPRMPPWVPVAGLLLNLGLLAGQVVVRIV